MEHDPGGVGDGVPIRQAVTSADVGVGPTDDDVRPRQPDLLVLDEPPRLGDDGGVGPDASLEQERCADAVARVGPLQGIIRIVDGERRHATGAERDDDVAGQLDVGRGDGPDGLDDAGGVTLGVVGPETGEEVAVSPSDRE